MKHIAQCTLVLLIVAAISIATLSRWSSTDQDRDAIASPASRNHPAGTDDLGRDRAVRLASAALLSSLTAVAAAVVCTALSLAAAVAAAFAPPLLTGALLYCSDLFLTLPWLFLLLIVRSVLPLNTSAWISAAITSALIAGLGWPVYVRSLHGRVANLRASDWMIQAHAGGMGAYRTARTQVLPHLKPLYLTQLLLCVPAFLIAEANLGAVGMGVSAPLVSWGSLLQELSISTGSAANKLAYLPLGALVAVLFAVELLAGKETT